MEIYIFLYSYHIKTHVLNKNVIQAIERVSCQQCRRGIHFCRQTLEIGVHFSEAAFLGQRGALAWRGEICIQMIRGRSHALCLERAATQTAHSLLSYARRGHASGRSAAKSCSQPFHSEFKVNAMLLSAVPVWLFEPICAEPVRLGKSVNN